jgi:hypothetical protein
LIITTYKDVVFISIIVSKPKPLLSMVLYMTYQNVLYQLANLAQLSMLNILVDCGSNRAHLVNTKFKDTFEL